MTGDWQVMKEEVSSNHGDSTSYAVNNTTALSVEWVNKQNAKANPTWDEHPHKFVI